MNVNLNPARKIFIAAVRLDPDERSAYLDQACEGDAELRSRVDALLRAHEEVGSFAESGGPGPLPTINQPPAESAGTQIGP